MSTVTYFDVDKTNLFSFGRNYFTSFTLNVNNMIIPFRLTYKYNKIFIWQPEATITIAKSNTEFLYYYGDRVFRMIFIDPNIPNSNIKEDLTPNNIFNQYKLGYIT